MGPHFLHTSVMKPPRLIVLLSDSTGDLGERFVRAFISQFPRDSFTFQVRSFVERNNDLETIFQGISGQNPIIFHTVMRPSSKKHIEEIARKKDLEAYDLTGGAMKFLEKASGLKSHPDPSTLHEINPEYEARIRALDFTVGHDDGLREEDLDEADIVLLGPSRTSKTPTSIYLAYKGYKVANIPLVPGTDVTPRLRRGPRLRLVGLTINPERLRGIRLQRAREEKLPGPAYIDPSSIEEEIRRSLSLYLELNCPVVDVTQHAVEETAALVLKALNLR